MQYRGKRAAKSIGFAYGCKHCLQSVSTQGIYICRIHEAVSHQRTGSASCSNDKNVFLKQFLCHYLEVSVLWYLDVVASGKQTHAPDVAIFDIIDEGLKRLFRIDLCKCGHYGFGRESRNDIALNVRDVYRLALPLFKCLDGNSDRFLGFYCSSLFREFNMLRAGNLADVHGRYYF